MRARKPGNATGLRCVRCSRAQEITPTSYGCEACGANTRVEYDLEAIGAKWKQSSLARNPDRTIWRYAPLLPVNGRLNGPPVGWTPLFEAPALSAALGLRRLLLKDDGRNPSASFKDRASSIALQRARDLGLDLITGASTGNAAAATAVLAAQIGIKARIFVPKTAPRAKIAQLVTFGAEVLAVDGTYDQAFDLCLAATKRFGWYNRNTGFNPFTREGKKTVAFEICEQLLYKTPDYVVVSVGDGNIISGVWKGFEEFKRLGFIDRTPRLVAVQAEGSAAIVNAVNGDGELRAVSGNTVADSISVSLPRDGEAAVQAIRASDGLALTVSDAEILAAIGELARGGGVFGEPAAAATLAGLKAAVRSGQVPAKSDVVLLITGNGLKDVDAAQRSASMPRVIKPELAELEALFR